MSIHNVFSWPISTFLLFSWIGKPVLDRDPVWEKDISIQSWGDTVHHVTTHYSGISIGKLGEFEVPLVDVGSL